MKIQIVAITNTFKSVIVYYWLYYLLIIMISNLSNNKFIPGKH